MELKSWDNFAFSFRTQWNTSTLSAPISIREQKASPEGGRVGARPHPALPTQSVRAQQLERETPELVLSLGETGRPGCSSLRAWGRRHRWWKPFLQEHALEEGGV